MIGWIEGIQNAIEYIEDNLTEELNIQEIAETHAGGRRRGFETGGFTAVGDKNGPQRRRHDVGGQVGIFKCQLKIMNS